MEKKKNTVGTAKSMFLLQDCKACIAWQEFDWPFL